MSNACDNCYKNGSCGYDGYDAGTTRCPKYDPKG